MSILTKQVSGKKTEKILGIVLIPLGIIALSYLMFVGTDTPSSPAKQEVYAPDEIELHVQAQEFVKQGLKAPSTAKFPTLPYDTSTDGNGLYRVVSYVDSQNSFGGVMRSDWSVTMRLTGERWVLEKLIIGNKLIYDITQNE